MRPNAMREKPSDETSGREPIGGGQFAGWAPQGKHGSKPLKPEIAAQTIWPAVKKSGIADSTT